MSSATNFKLLPLHEHRQFQKECCEMLNEEWKRSFTARMHSLEKSSNEMPLSLVLVEFSDTENASAVGHARFCRVLNNASACLVESVIIDRNRRGTGLGKLLVKEAEEYAKMLGFNTIYLTTNDKESFYKLLGYGDCKPVCSMNGAWMGNLMEKISTSLRDDVTCPKNLNLRRSVSTECNTHLPPPPPLPELPAHYLPSEKRTVWLSKHI